MRSKILLIVFSFLILSCDGGNPPEMADISLYLGVSRDLEYCRMTNEHFSDEVKLSKKEKVVFDAIVRLNDFEECYSTADPNFDRMILVSVNDLQIILDYIRTLRFKCDKWKK